ncbi:hypothetical protein [Paraburkholderia sartisoli]|uniref:Uncharacterized protein n=1 Tax=Paraburkholderia sartisoli TaxID=83784 RepID=A0A1H3YFX8_9BURK|nr:hypothetical protein [Paraburkholderia sartisoli]SEA10457.1 hypothetical protein SAMN05192564_101289 [Paraburkholderia sartisoli]
MMRRTVVVVAGSMIGLLIGCLFDLIPVAIEKSTGVYLCRESCPPWFRLGSLCVYLVVPIVWAVLPAFSAGESAARTVRAVMAFAIGSSALMLAITWFAYAHQAQLI